MPEMPRTVCDMLNETITWGDQLSLALKRAGGLKQLTDRLQEAAGFFAPSRATYSKLLKVESPESLDTEEMFRAYMLLLSMGLDPKDWGIPDSVVPDVFDIERFCALIVAPPTGLEPVTFRLHAANYLSIAGSLLRTAA